MQIDIVKYKEQNIFTVQDYLDLVEKWEPYILDIRSETEYCQGHLCGAYNIQTPLPPLYEKDVIQLADRLNRICVSGKDSLIIVYCKLGKRAGLAKRILESLGYTNVLSFGGIDTEPLKSVMKGLDNRIPICKCDGSSLI